MSGFLGVALLLAAPLLLAAAGELLLERAGSIQIGLEGTMLIGAFTAFAAARSGAGPHTALLAAAFAGLLAGAAFAVFAVAGRADPILVGTAWNLVAAGGTAFSYRLLAGATGSVLEVRTLPPLAFGLPAAVARGFLRSGRRGSLSRTHAPGPRARGRWREPSRSRGDGRLGRRRADGRLASRQARSAPWAALSSSSRCRPRSWRV